MYQDQRAPEIYWKRDIQKNVVDSSINSEWCHKQVSGIEIETELTELEVAAQSKVPEELPAFQAVHWNGRSGVDLRPHVWDGILKCWMLLDSGSQVTAFPPDPGDQAVPGHFLRAVNGSKIKCYGQKKAALAKLTFCSMKQPLPGISK